MNKILLITRPKYDETTHYLFNWAKEIIDIANAKGIQVLDLKKEKANKKNLTSFINKKQPAFIFFNGHGDVDCVTGQDSKILVKVRENETLLKSKIVYALSCRSGKELGVESIKTGTLSYIGYDDDFIFLFEEGKLTRPLEDNLAKLFLEPSNYVVNSLLKGHTAKDSYMRSKKLFMANIQKLVISKSSSDMVPFLLWDMKHQVCLGDKEAVF